MNAHVKVQVSDRKINPFGGINFVIWEMEKMKIDELIDKRLGKRPKQAKYSYYDVILGWIYANLCGAERIEDTQHIRTVFNIPEIKVPSSDRISQIFRALATNIITYKEKNRDGKTIVHQFNYHEFLSTLLLEIILKLKLLTSNHDYLLDYDNTIIECEKYDSAHTYVQCKGYQPGVCFIKNLPVYIENRNGNSPAKYKMHETLTRAFELLKEKGITISRFRSDSAAYQSKVFRLLDKHPDIEYFIKIQTSKYFYEKNSSIDDWEEMSKYELEMGSKQFNAFGKKRRLIVIRKPDDKALDGYKYSGIITNNSTLINREVLYLYNQRGAAERNFDDLKNNFNWGRLPFSFLNENTVFLIVSAMSYVVYRSIIKKFSSKVEFVKKSFRLKNFIFHFMTVGSEWADQNVFRLYTDKNYQAIMRY